MDGRRLDMRFVHRRGAEPRALQRNAHQKMAVGGCITNHCRPSLVAVRARLVHRRSSASDRGPNIIARRFFHGCPPGPMRSALSCLVARDPLTQI